MQSHSQQLQDNHVPNDPIQSELDQYHIGQFKQRYIFKPFQYEDKLEQTLLCQIDSCNVKVPQSTINSGNSIADHTHHHSINIDQMNSVRNSNVRFGAFSNCDAFDSTSKSIKTNKTIFCSDMNDQLKLQQKTKPKIDTFPGKPLSHPPNLAKKTISFTSAVKNQLCSQAPPMLKSEQRPNRSLKKSSQLNKKKYEQEQKSRGLFYDRNNLSSFNSSEKNINKASTSLKNNLSSIPENEPSMCQSIALGSQMVQNFIRAIFENISSNSHCATGTPQGFSTKNQSQAAQPMNFYSFCMLLFPETPKSTPCSVFVMDTLFYINSSESKQIIYIFKDKKRNLLTKVKNKNKNAYELFMKRRLQYETAKAKEEKLRKTGWYENREKKLLNGVKGSWLNASKSNWKAGKSTGTKQVKFHTIESLTHNKSLESNSKMRGMGQNKEYESSVKCLDDSNLDDMYGKYGQRYSIVEEEELASSRHVNKDDSQIKKKQQKDVENEGSPLKKVLGNSDHKQSQDISRMSYHSEDREEVRKMSKMSLGSTFKSFMRQKEADRVKSPPHSSKTSTPGMSQGHQKAMESVRLTPSNSIRQSVHTLQTNYMALLKYCNSQIIRLKPQQFKAIFHNPLYANERFKNNNNTQYIQALPIQDELEDLKVYSIHFHYELFKDQPLFLHVKNTLYMENQYISGGGVVGSKGSVGDERDTFQQSIFQSTCHNFPNQATGFDSLSPQNRFNLQLKQKLRQDCVEVYLYYQVFQMYTYASMHYNKQILSGIFRFIQYDNEYALFETENVIAKNMPNEGQFIKAKIFAEENLQDPKINDLTTKLNNSGQSGLSTPSQTMKKIDKEMEKLAMEQSNEEQTELQRVLTTYFSGQNTKIEQDMSAYFTDKIEKIKNVKDSHLSKSIFRVINNLPPQENLHNPSGNYRKSIENIFKTVQPSDIGANSECLTPEPCQSDGFDFHSILNDDKKLERFLKKKERNDPYARKNISNYSVVRWKQEVRKIEAAKSQTSKFNKMSINSGNETKQKRSEPLSSKQFVRPTTACSLGKKKSSQEHFKFTHLNLADTNFFKTTVRPDSVKQNNLPMQISHSESLFASFNAHPLQRFNHTNSTKQDWSVSSGEGLHLRQTRRFSKKIINSKYTQINKIKFKLNGFRADRFF